MIVFDNLHNMHYAKLLVVWFHSLAAPIAVIEGVSGCARWQFLPFMVEKKRVSGLGFPRPLIRSRRGSNRW